MPVFSITIIITTNVNHLSLQIDFLSCTRNEYIEEINLVIVKPEFCPLDQYIAQADTVCLFIVGA